MSKFEVGQEIECVCVNGCVHLTVGKKYTVIDCECGLLAVINDNGLKFKYISFLFRLADQYPNPPHKHKDLIIAWANGADIEHKYGDYWRISSPKWSTSQKYRIKPSEKSDKDTKIEELEAKANELLSKIKELKESNNG